MHAKLHCNEPPRLLLANLPTPVVELRNLSAALEIPPILMKRDDLTGMEFSGNKIRKLEYLLADAKENGCDAIVTYGGFQSNHCRATAAAGARLGMKVRLLLRAAENPANDGNLFLDRMFGADITLHAPAEFNQHRQTLIDEAMDQLRERGMKPYYIPVGASVPMGCWGYIRCIHELSQQLPIGDEIDLYVPLSSAGTFAGAVIALELFELRNWRAIGIPVSDSIAYFQTEVRQLERATNLRFNLQLPESPIDLLDGSIGEGYAIPTPAALEMTRALARSEGILVDPTYTSKAFTGMIDSIRSGARRKNATAVFLHTGGIFGLFARRDLFS